MFYDDVGQFTTFGHIFDSIRASMLLCPALDMRALVSISRNHHGHVYGSGLIDPILEQGLRQSFDGETLIRRAPLLLLSGWAPTWDANVVVWRKP